MILSSIGTLFVFVIGLAVGLGILACRISELRDTVHMYVSDDYVGSLSKRLAQLEKKRETDRAGFVSLRDMLKETKSQLAELRQRPLPLLASADGDLLKMSGSAALPGQLVLAGSVWQARKRPATEGYPDAAWPDGADVVYVRAHAVEDTLPARPSEAEEA